jgi:hypothetical protein
VPDTIALHVPVASHDKHGFEQELEQHTFPEGGGPPGAQKPVRHWLAAAHAVPAFCLQEPAPSHATVGPEQPAVCTLAAAFTHAPPAPVQLWQVAHALCAQQCASTQ